MVLASMSSFAGAADPLTDAEQTRLGAALDAAIQVHARGDQVACREHLMPVRDLAWRGLRPRGFEWPFLWAECKFWAETPPTGGLDAVPIEGLFEPWRERFNVDAERLSVHELQFLHGYWRHLNRWAGSAAADAMFLPLIRQWLAEAAGRPQDEAYSAALRWQATAMYGAWELHDYTRQFHGWFEQALGPTHPASLLMLRALAYGERFHGRPQTSSEYSEKAARLVLEHHPHDERLRTALLAERAQGLAVSGRLAEALEAMLPVREALLRRQPLPMEGLIRTHYNLAGYALEMGDYPAAIAYAEQSIDYAQRLGNPTMLVEARVPRAIREVSRLMLGEPDAAAGLKSVLEETQDQEMHIGTQVFALVRHAAEVNDRALLSWSTELMNRYIARYRTPFHIDRALLPLMQAWRDVGLELRSSQARPSLDRAVAGSLTGRSLGTEALTQFSLARHLAPAQPAESIWLYKRGANALQQLRTGLPSGNAELHRAWLASHERDLRAFIGLLIDRGRLVEAEQAVRFLRDEEIVEYTRRARAKRSVTIEALSYTADEADRNVGMDALAARVRQAASAADVRADAWRRLDSKHTYRDDEAEAAMAAFTREVGELAQPPASPAQAAPQARGSAAVALAPGVVRLTYFVRGNAVDVLMQRGRNVRTQSLPIARDELNRRVQDLRAAVGSPQRDAMPAARALYVLLIAPIEPWLKRGRQERLQIAPDASLRYLPFAALHDGRRYLAERFVIVTDLAGSAVREGEAAVPGRIVAFGRSTGTADHAALPGVERELAAVEAADVRSGRAALNEAFTAARLKQALEQGPAVVHIASHFELSPAGEDKSYLLLGDGERMSLADLRQLRWQGVQLAVLSACDSAVTVDAGRGRELVGFATALLGVGARNVLASLWRVSDGATAQWMESFYRQPRGRPAVLGPQTLARTQRDWLRAHPTGPLAHPHYWAAFTWIGAP
jgi:CHAT domain-containing protein